MPWLKPHRFLVHGSTWFEFSRFEFMFPSILLCLKRKISHFYKTTNPFIYLSLYSRVTYSSIHPPTHLSIYPSTFHLPTNPINNPSIQQSIHPFTLTFIHLLICQFPTYTPNSSTLSIHLPTHRSIQPSILHQRITHIFIHHSSIHPWTHRTPTHEPTNPFIHPPSLVSKLSLLCLLCSRFYDS